MKLNAEQNFWNGAPCPLGYKLIEVKYLHGGGTSGSMGVKELVKWLNSRGYRTRKGNTFGVGMLHRMLTKYGLYRRLEVQPILVTHRQAQG
jgi:site-specific DNA recombinase